VAGKQSDTVLPSPAPATGPHTPASANVSTLNTPKGTENAHREMNEVISDLRGDFAQTALALLKLDNFEQNSPAHHGDPGLCPPELVLRMREELKAARAAVRVLKADKDKTHQKLERLDQLLLKERSSLRDVLNAARKAFADLKSEKEQMRKRLYKERAKYTDGIQGERLQRKALEDELDRLRLELRSKDSDLADSELQGLDAQARSAIEYERTTLHAQLAAAEKELAEVKDEVFGIDEDTHQTVTNLFQALEQLEKDMLEAHRDQREAEIKVDQSRDRASKVSSEASQDKHTLNSRLAQANDDNRKLRAELDAVKRSVAVRSGSGLASELAELSPSRSPGGQY